MVRRGRAGLAACLPSLAGVQAGHDAGRAECPTSRLPAAWTDTGEAGGNPPARPM